MDYSDLPNTKLLRKISKLTPERREELDTVLTKFLSGETITDMERKENPEMWTHAEKFFKFGSIAGR